MLDCFCVYSVVRRVGADEANPCTIEFEIKLDDKPILIAFDIENHSMIAQYTCRWVVSFYFIEV